MTVLKPFVINATDIQFILDQLNFRPLFDAAGNVIFNWDGTGAVYNSNVLATRVLYADMGSAAANIGAYGTSYQSAVDLAGLRDVTGLNNNLALIHAQYGAVDSPFPRVAANFEGYSSYYQSVVNTVYAAAKQYYSAYAQADGTFNTANDTALAAPSIYFIGKVLGADPLTYIGPKATDGTPITIQNVVDYTPRMISLATTTADVKYDTWANHAAENAALPANQQHTANEIYYDAKNVATVLDWGQLKTVADGGLGQVDTQARLAASAGQDDHFIGGLNPGVAPSNGFFVLFGQFFDHGLDFIDKSSGKTIKIALAKDDPLYGMKGPDGQPVHEITINRATVATVDANGNPQYTNHTSPFIDQSQTYGSHAQLTTLLREWVEDPANPGKYHAGMKLLDGQTLATSWTKADGTVTNETLPTLNELRAAVIATGRDALTWEDVSDLRNRDAEGHVTAGTSGSALLLDMNPRFDAAHMNQAQISAAVEAAALKAATPGDVVGTSVAYGYAGGQLSSVTITTTTNGTAVVETVPLYKMGPTAMGLIDPSNFSNAGLSPVAHAAANEILLESVGDHYIAGDGRVNENFGLTSIHHVFHEEHNYQVQNLMDALHTQDVVTNDVTHAKLHEFQVDTNGGLTNAAGDYIDAAGHITWDQDKMFNGAKLIVEMEYQHAAVDQYARNVTPNIQEFVGYSADVNSAVSLEYAQGAFRFGHSTLRETIDTIDPSHGLTGKIMGYALKAAFLSPEQYAAVGPAAIVLGMSHQQMNEVDEFVTPALNQGLLGQPLDLAAINIARGRDIGMPTLNDFREAVGLARYTSWNDFGQNMQHPTSLVNFIAAYSFDGDMAKAQAIIGLVDGTIAEADLAAAQGFTVSQAYAFINGGDTGFNHIDTWLGGLAEIHQPGGLLGETFDKVFVNQIESLMDGDRFYYLYRLAGQQFAEEVGNGQLKDIVERNTGLVHLNGNIFGYADDYVDLGAHKEVVATTPDPLGTNPTGELQTTGNEHKYGDVYDTNGVKVADGALTAHAGMGVYSNGGRGNLNDGNVVKIGGVDYIQDTRLAHGFNVNVDVANANFDAPALANGGFTVTAPTGWTIAGAGGLVDADTSGAINGAAYVQNGAVISQDTGKTLAAGDDYSLSLNVSGTGGTAKLVATNSGAFHTLSSVALPATGAVWQTVTLASGKIPAQYAGWTLQVEVQETSAPGPLSSHTLFVDDVKITGVAQLNDGVNLDGTPNSGAESNEIIVATANNDLIYAQGGDDTVYGEAGNDKIYGGFGIDRLYGGDGADSIYGGDNPDLIDGGSGDDKLYGESSGSDINGNDQVIGGSGNDFISGGIGIDKLSGGTGDDTIYGDQDTDPFTHGSDGNDYVDGGSGGDILYGDNGDDILAGRNDQDQLFGGKGDDILRPGDQTGALTIGTDEVLGGDGVVDDGTLPNTRGFDLVDFSDNALRPGGVVFNLADQQNPALNVNGTPKQIAVWQVEGLVGSVGDDTLTGDSAGDQGNANPAIPQLDNGENWLIGGSGNDLLEGAGGNDVIVGGSIRLDALIGSYQGVQYDANGFVIKDLAGNPVSTGNASTYDHNMDNNGVTDNQQLLDALYQGASHRAGYADVLSGGLIEAANAAGGTQFEKHFTEMLRTEMFKDTVLGDGGANGVADTAVFSGNRLDYDVAKITFTPPGSAVPMVAYKITDLRDPAAVDANGALIPTDGTDIVVGVGQFKFADGTLVGEHALLQVPPVIDTLNAVPFAVAENVALNTLAATIAAHDPNAGDVVAYSIVSGNLTVGGSPLLAIDPATGAVTLAQVPNYEALTGLAGVTVAADNLSLTFTVTIGASDGIAMASKPFTFQINNVPEAATGGVALAGDVAGTNGAQAATLTATSTILDPDLVSVANPTGAAPVAYQWQSSNNNGATWTNIAGATAATYAPVAATLAHVVATYSDPFGQQITTTQAAQIGTNQANTIAGTTGADLMIGLNGGDTYTVNDANDVVVEIATSTGTDTVQTSLAAYTLAANVENLSFDNGAAADIAFTATGNALDNTITGGTLSDTAVFAGDITVAGFGRTGGGNLTVTTATGGTDTLSSIENVQFKDVNNNDVSYNVAIGNNNANAINGSAAADLIAGFGGNDTINAGDGGDVIEWNVSGTVTATGNAPNFNFNPNVTTDGRDIIDGGVGIDTFVLNSTVTGVGNNAARLAAANARPDVAETFRIYSKADWLLLGGAGNNGHTLVNANTEIIITRNGTTNGSVVAELRNVEELVINTGAGSDNVIIIGNFSPTHLAQNTIHINDADGGDNVDISGLTSSHRIVFSTDATGTVTGTLRPQDIVDHSGHSAGTTGTGTGTTSTTTSATTDTTHTTDDGGITCGTTDDAGNTKDTSTSHTTDTTGGTTTTTTTTTAADTSTTPITGDGAVLSGTDGNDAILGTSTTKMIVAAGGDDHIFAGDGGVNVIAGDGNDTVNTGSGADNVFGGNGHDTIITGGGDDNVWGEDGDDTILTGDGNDNTWGGSGSDTIDTGSGNDRVWGGDGADNIHAGAGDDRIEGGDGADTLWGDSGDDAFVFRTVTAADGDTIADFQPGDRIDLSGIDPGNGLGSFMVVNGSSFTGAGELIIHAVDGNTIIEGNVSGDTTADFHITITGDHVDQLKAGGIVI